MYDLRYSRKREVYVTADKMNEHLKFVKDIRNILYEAPYLPMGCNAFIEDKQIQFSLTYKIGSYACTYIVRKDESKKYSTIKGHDSYMTLSHYYKIPIYTDLRFSAKPLLWKNDLYDGTRNYAYGYDKNSAYASVMYNEDFPDTSVEPKFKMVTDNEIGFNSSGDLVPTGKKAVYVFPKMPSPFKRFIEKWERNKEKAKKNNDPYEYAKAKDMMNYCIGYLQLKNPFLRSFIVNKCNQYILDHVDDNTLYCNTDSIVSLVPLDLPLSDKLGEWKVEHEGMFAFNGFNFQWDKETPHIRGVARTWFPKDWDILVDDLPSGGNVWEFDDKKFQLVKIKRRRKENE